MSGTMQSSLPANMDGNENDDIIYDKANTLSAAATFEGDGTVLAEHYNFEEYIHRRGMYIGRLPAYSHLPNAYFIARRHAAEIFDDEYQLLMVEEVRKRELDHEFDPLLPLPTTTNTQTIDNFKTCPPKGMSSEIDDDLNREMSQSPKAFFGDANHSTPPTSPINREALNKQYQMQGSGKQAEFTGTKAFPIDPSLIDLAIPGLQQNKNFSQPMQAQSKYPSLETEFQAPEAQMTPVFTPRQQIPANPGLMQYTYPNLVNKTSVNAVAVDPSGSGQNKTAAAATAGSLLTNAAPSTTPKPTTSQLEKTFTPDPRVSSMARFGIVKNVKATKNAFTPELVDLEQLENTNTSTSRAVAPAPASSQAMASMNARFAATFADSEEPVESELNEPVQPTTKRQKVTRVRGVAQKVKKSAVPSSAHQTNTSANFKAATKESTTDKAQQHLESVIAGTALPKNKAEAQAAADEHHDRLLATHNKRKRTAARGAAKKTPDLLPYFFEAANFDSDGANVRCICGCIDEDGGDLGDEMVQCEKCDVWQHYACVLPGMDEAQIEKLKTFECTVCDPWARRFVLMNLRKNDSKIELEQ